MDERWVRIPKGSIGFTRDFNDEEGEWQPWTVHKDLIYSLADEERCLYTDIEDGEEWLFWRGDDGNVYAVPPEDVEVLTPTEVLAHQGGRG